MLYFSLVGRPTSWLLVGFNVLWLVVLLALVAATVIGIRGLWMFMSCNPELPMTESQESVRPVLLCAAAALLPLLLWITGTFFRSQSWMSSTLNVVICVLTIFVTLVFGLRARTLAALIPDRHLSNSFVIVTVIAIIAVAVQLSCYLGLSDFLNQLVWNSTSAANHQSPLALVASSGLFLSALWAFRLLSRLRVRLDDLSSELPSLVQSA